MKITLILVGLLLAGVSYGQKSPKEEKADTYFKNYSYEKAIEKYNSIDGLGAEGKRNLAVSYQRTNQIEEASNVYSELVGENAMIAEDYYNYAMVLKAQGNYTTANDMLEKFTELSPSDTRATEFQQLKVKQSDLQNDKGQYKITHLDINTEDQDFAPVYFNDKIVFASTREGVTPIKRKWNWNQKPFLNLYIADRDGEQLANPELLDKTVNKKFHEGVASFAKDGMLMAYTSDNYDEKSEDGTVKLEIFFSSYENDKWTSPEGFSLNNKEYSVGHPSLSKDGNVMYFASDMPGGKGGVDIYRIEKDGEGKWGEPQNLSINTEGNEMFPFYQEDQEMLFFASNGHFGLGGLDLFVSPFMGDNFYKAVNLGAPINTSADDFALIVDEKMKKGYFSSNREGGKGDDDIYAFDLLKPITFGKTIKGTAKDKEGNILAGTLVKLFDESGDVVSEVTTAEDGSYSFTVDPEKNFKLTGDKEKYFSGKNTADTHTEEDEIIADVILEKDPGLALYALITDKKTGDALDGVKMTIIDNMTGQSETYTTPETGDYLRPLADKKLNDRGSYNITIEKEGYFTKTVTYNTAFDKPGKYNVHEALDLGLDPEVKDLSEMVQINPINFDYNKYNIRADAAVELDKIVSIMNKYPEMIVELGAHTDCRGSDSYNERLSDKRAKASAKYIAERITKPERIYGKGYGENKLLEDCGGNCKACTDEQHAKNRRTEFKVISTGNDKVKVNNTSTDSFE